MRTIYLTFFLFLLISGCKQTTNEISKSEIDSVYFYLKKSRNKKLDNLSRLKALDKSFVLIKDNLDSSKNRDTLFNICYKYYELQDWDNFSKSINILFKKSVQNKDSINIAKAYRFKGNYFKRIEKYDSSFYNYSKAEKVYYKINDKLNYANILYNKGIVQYRISDYFKAELSLYKAYSILKNSNDNEKLYGVLNELGLVCNELSEFDKSLFYMNEALLIAKKSTLQDNIEKKAMSLSNIAFVLQSQKKFNEAIVKYNETLKNKEAIKSFPVLYSNILDNLGACKLEVKDFQDLPNLFIESLNIREDIGNSSTIILSLKHISEYYRVKNNPELAEKYAIKALNLAISSKNTIDYISALQQASLVNEKYLSTYAKDYAKINDSLQIAERNSKDRFARIQFETDEIIQENEGLAEKNRNLLYVFVVSFIVVVLLFVVRAQRARTRELLYKQAQQKANEDIYNLMMSQQAIIDESRSKEKKRLAQDLHDGVLGRMFGLRLNLDSLNSSANEDAIQKRFELLNELKTIEQDIREISHDLNREKQVLINNFVSIVHNLLEEQKASFDANVTYFIDNDVVWDKISNTIKINLYRILQEGLQNINKYANAKNIIVEIKGDEENVYLKIQDDGIGFDVNRKSKGIGMQNMISRTHDCKGIIDINSKKEQGTKIVITIPIETKPIIAEQE